MESGCSQNISVGKSGIKSYLLSIRFSWKCWPRKVGVLLHAFVNGSLVKQSVRPEEKHQRFKAFIASQVLEVVGARRQVKALTRFLKSNRTRRLPRIIGSAAMPLRYSERTNQCFCTFFVAKDVPIKNTQWQQKHAVRISNQSKHTA